MKNKTRSSLLVVLLVGSLFGGSLSQANPFSFEYWQTKWDGMKTNWNNFKENKNYKDIQQFQKDKLGQYRSYKETEPRAQQAENFAQIGLSSIGMMIGGNGAWKKLTQPQKQSRFAARPISFLAYLGLAGWSFNCLRNGFKKMEHTNKQIRRQDAIKVLEEANGKKSKTPTVPSKDNSNSDSK